MYKLLMYMRYKNNEVRSYLKVTRFFFFFLVGEPVTAATGAGEVKSISSSNSSRLRLFGVSVDGVPRLSCCGALICTSSVATQVRQSKRTYNIVRRGREGVLVSTGESWSRFSAGSKGLNGSSVSILKGASTPDAVKSNLSCLWIRCTSEVSRCVLSGV